MGELPGFAGRLVYIDPVNHTENHLRDLGKRWRSSRSLPTLLVSACAGLFRLCIPSNLEAAQHRAKPTASGVPTMDAVFSARRTPAASHAVPGGRSHPARGGSVRGWKESGRGRGRINDPNPVGNLSVESILFMCRALGTLWGGRRAWIQGI